ncbi:ATP-binding cassette domain-containing protein [Streptomyces aurantiogriseus]|uniref:ABC-type xenobiotic transporter n=1 Tax=Streptomyces aurantiogriseus TaxID=66870 RepID=A0A918FLV3_9ACTN|nr:ATP-binding cassette domain-containing protein [Streptomyces aurantiogriseus]GGR52177.1 daunorubicin resistance protein DrrA family ABC transporter ATP-binding protein [Streptomyces aurantiogriseus]
MNTSAGATTDGIVAVGLRKSYGDKTVLDGVDLHIPQGTVFSLLGPNGAGKTTTVQILSTLIPADGGEARVAGHLVDREADAVRSAIGVTGQFSAVDNLLTAAENMMLVADLLHLPKDEGRRRTADLLARFDLTDVADKPASTFSGGMRRKLDLAMTLVGRPSVIFLDEPTTGLDPASRRNLWDIIQDLVSDGVTIFLTTQYLEEADHLADRIALLDGGRIVAEGTPDELKRRIPGGHIRLRFADQYRFENASRVLAEAVRDEESLILQIASDGSIPALRGLLGRLEDAGIDAEELTVHTPDLDDVFLALTGRRKAGPADEAAHSKKAAKEFTR